MCMAETLSDLKVLVTRPAGQARTLCDGIEQAGAQAIAFPVIEIVPIVTSTWAIASLPTPNIIIFVSRNAVMHFVAGWQGELPSEVKLIAVGAGTAAEMQAAGLRVDSQPEMENSEGLLSLLSLDQLDNKSIWIVRGEGGRAHLASRLHALGATVVYLEVYQRVLGNASPAQRTLAATANCAVVTSVAGLDNMGVLLAEALHMHQQQPLIVISDRIARHAVQCGFKQVIVSAGASDDMIIAALGEIA